MALPSSTTTRKIKETPCEAAPNPFKGGFKSEIARAVLFQPSSSPSPPGRSDHLSLAGRGPGEGRSTYESTCRNHCSHIGNFLSRSGRSRDRTFGARCKRQDDRRAFLS